ncbi:diacylglycerol/lipid kinase family protein [Arenibaculum pallidiluteum]|uniref:diacylglycerol/lipid kinase family protein n=1 Tax=Arenibaculum pallidiluteum TaxID=2812559 RepID=UPI001A969C30|nr:diacylglycerol kinase family protein [Arenibaculum pallidiluteum]
MPEESVQPRRLLVVRNPTAGRRRVRRYRAVLDALQDLGAEVEIRETAGRGDAERIAREADPAAHDALVVAGGDGTVNEALNGLLSRAEGPAPALGLIPLGTANVLAAELGLPRGAKALARILALGAPRRIHPGLTGGRGFSMMVGAGLDAQVVERVDPVLKRLSGKGAYVWETLSQLVRHRPRRYRVTVGGTSWEVGSVIVAKGHFYAGRFVCAPAARLDEPILQVCLFPRIGRWHALRYTAAVVLGFVHHLRDYAVVPADRVLIDGPEGDPVQGDGDVIARLPVEVTLAPRGIEVLAGPTGFPRSSGIPWARFRVARSQGICPTGSDATHRGLSTPDRLGP